MAHLLDNHPRSYQQQPTTCMEAHYNNLNKKLDSLQVDDNKCSKHPSSKHPTHNQQQRFYPRTVNLTNVAFTKEELELLDLGMQFNIQQPLNSYWTNLIIETEQAIRNWTSCKTHSTSWLQRN
jgi:hypothetical protein